MFTQLGDAHFIFLSTCATIKNHAGIFIQWPDHQEMAEIARHFSVPNTIGKEAFKIEKFERISIAQQLICVS